MKSALHLLLFTTLIMLFGMADVLTHSQTRCDLPPSRKADEYGNAKAGDDEPRLERFAATLKSD